MNNKIKTFWDKNKGRIGFISGITIGAAIGVAFMNKEYFGAVPDQFTWEMLEGKSGEVLNMILHEKTGITNRNIIKVKWSLSRGDTKDMIDRCMDILYPGD